MEQQNKTMNAYYKTGIVKLFVTIQNKQINFQEFLYVLQDVNSKPIFIASIILN